MPFSYPDIARVGQPAKATHISTIRTYVDQTAAPLPPQYRYSFSWSNINPGAPILAKYVTEMRSAIQLLWNFKSRGTLPNWSSGITPGGASNGRNPTVIRASDITDLRRWLDQYLDNHAPLQQGIDSKSFDANDGRKPVVLDSAIGGDADWNWVGDIGWLWNHPELGRLRVRTVITAPSEGQDPLSSSDVAGYNLAFQRYATAEIPVYVLIGSEFYKRGSVLPYTDLNADLNSSRTNEYIEGFANKASILTTGPLQWRFANVSGYIIFNEPNVGNAVRPENFAALLRRCRERMGSSAAIYSGGLQVGANYDPNPVVYLRRMYEWITNNGAPDTPWPWTGVNFHFHHNSRTAPDINYFFQNGPDYPDDPNQEGLRTLMSRVSDERDILIGEWGVTQQEFAASSTSLSTLYANLIANSPTIMFFFARQPVADPITPSTSTWGLRNWVPPIGVVVEQPSHGAQFSFKLTAKNGSGGAFYNAYDNLIGT